MFFFAFVFLFFLENGAAEETDLYSEGYKNPAGINFSHFDETVRPQDEFYRWVTGTWQDNAKFLPGRGSTGTLAEVRTVTQKKINNILSSVAKIDDPSLEERILKNAYLSLTNLSLVQGKGAESVRFLLDRVDSIQTRGELYDFLAKHSFWSIRLPFSFGVLTDFENPDQNRLSFFQSGLSLSSRDYYLGDDENLQKIRSKFPEFGTWLFEKAGYSHPSLRAKDSFEFETQLAEIQWSEADRQNLEKITNTTPAENLPDFAPLKFWDAIFDHMKIEKPEIVNISQPDYFEGLGILLARTPLEKWKNYLRFQVLRGASRYLSDEFRQIYFEYNDKLLSGVEESMSRKEWVTLVLSAYLDDAIGKVYVENYFPKEAKEKIWEMVENIKQVFALKIPELEWMTDQTKEKALEKLEKLNVEIGYPSKWEDYIELDLNPDEPIKNIHRLSEFRERSGLNKLYEKPDKTAQTYREKTKKESIRRRLLSDPHAPSEYRVNAVFSLFTPFYDAFDVQEGDGMYLPPEKRIEIW